MDKNQRIEKKLYPLHNEFVRDKDEANLRKNEDDEKEKGAIMINDIYK